MDIRFDTNVEGNVNVKKDTIENKKKYYYYNENIGNSKEDDEFDKNINFYATHEQNEQNEPNNNECANCKSVNIVEHSGSMVCKQCGILLDDCIETTMDTIQYNDDGKNSMNKSCFVINKLLPQTSMTTTINGPCSNIQKTIHNWGSILYHERKLSTIFRDFKNVCEKAKIPKCIEDDAKIIFKIISDCKYTGNNKKIRKNKSKKSPVDENEQIKNIIFRGKNMEGLKAACLNYACRKNNKPLSPKEFAKLFDLPIKKVTKGIKLFENFMIINNFVTYSEISPEYFVVHFCSELNIKKIFIDLILQIIKNIEKIQIANKHTPLSIATGAIFLLVKIYDLNITNKAIANYFNISQVTISKAYRTFEPFKKILLNNDICDAIAEKIKIYQNDISISNELKYKFIRFNIDITKINAKNNNYSIIENNGKLSLILLKQYNDELNNILLHWYDEYNEISERQINILFEYYKNKMTNNFENI